MLESRPSQKISQNSEKYWRADPAKKIFDNSKKYWIADPAKKYLKIVENGIADPAQNI